MNQGRRSSENLAVPQMKYHDRNPLVRYANQRFLSTIRSYLQTTQFETLLDAGCGEGVVLSDIATHNQVNLFGLDLDLERVRYAKESTQSQHLIQGDAQTLPFPSESFDLVMLLEVLEHVGEPRSVLKEAQRVTARYLLASVPNEPWWRIGNMMRLKYLRAFGNTPEHINHWTISGFRSLISQEFNIVSMRYPMLWTFVLAEKR